MISLFFWFLVCTDAETWFCTCPSLYSSKPCQFTACEQNPCARGATCVPQTRLDTVCLCPYGTRGLLCDEGISGDDFVLGVWNGSIVHKYNLIYNLS
ncbi:hypothetical protein cypCar_00015669 [Cyprinus carpio]|nr:hypothetical protein cypCar_00015669 [Cyprinus carpio]